MPGGALKVDAPRPSQQTHVIEGKLAGRHLVRAYATRSALRPQSLQNAAGPMQNATAVIGKNPGSQYATVVPLSRSTHVEERGRQEPAACYPPESSRCHTRDVQLTHARRA